MKHKRKSIIATCVVAAVLLGASLSAMTVAFSPKTDDEIAAYILDKLSYSDNENLLYYLWGPVLKGETIQSTQASLFTTPSTGYVLYIDLHPRANMHHPVQYVFLAEPTQNIQVFDTDCSPGNFQDYRLIGTPFSDFFYSVENRRAPQNEITNPDLDKNTRDNRWAVLMNGGADQYNNHVRYWNDLSNIYITLHDTYEFADENIIVLCSDGLNPAVDQSNGMNSDPDLDGDGDDDIMYACTLANVDLVFTNLAVNFTIYDKLFVFTTDHGGSSGGYNTYENLWNSETLSDAHFASLLAAFPECEKICTFEPCFSGGFLDNIIVPPGPIVGSSACNYDEYSYAMNDLVYDEYVFHWTAAVNGQDAYGTIVDADVDNNEIVSMDEAYIYAEAHDAQPESPQYGEYPQDTGSQLSLKVSSAPPAEPTKPTGPTLGIWHIEYTYSSSTTEPDNEQIYYLFDWGDGINSGWVGPYTSGQTGTASHNWTQLGTFNVKVKARDVWGSSSLWSDVLAVTITDNTPPAIPQITGPAEGKPGNQYLFNIQTTDAQDQNIYYFVDWGDNTTTEWLGPYVSGTEIHVKHSWTEQGTFTVKVKAKDIFDSESTWGTLEVVMPTKLMPGNHFLQWLFEHFPHTFPLIRQLWGY